MTVVVMLGMMAGPNWRVSISQRKGTRKRSTAKGDGSTTELSKRSRQMETLRTKVGRLRVLRGRRSTVVGAVGSRGGKQVRPSGCMMMPAGSLQSIKLIDQLRSVMAATATGIWRRNSPQDETAFANFEKQKKNEKIKDGRVGEEKTRQTAQQSFQRKRVR